MERVNAEGVEARGSTRRVGAVAKLKTTTRFIESLFSFCFELVDWRKLSGNAAKAGSAFL